MLLCKNTATFWDVRLAPFPGRYPWAVIKEQPLWKMAASSFLWGPGNLFSSQGAKNFLSSWVPISFETAGVSDSGLGMWFVSPWNLRVKRECAPSPSQANNPLPLKFFFFSFLFPPIEVLYLRSMAHGWDHYANCKIFMSGDGYIVLGRGSFVFIIFSKE